MLYICFKGINLLTWIGPTPHFLFCEIAIVSSTAKVYEIRCRLPLKVSAGIYIAVYTIVIDNIENT